MISNGGAERLDNAAIDLAAAQIMSSWFVDYRYGVQEEPGPIPALTAQRLKGLLGDGDVKKQLALVKDELPLFDEAYRPDLSLYLCGYPDDALEILAPNMSTTLRLLGERFVPKVEVEPAIVVELVPEIVIAAGRRAVHNTPVPSQKRREPGDRFPGESETDYRERRKKVAAAAAARQAPVKPKPNVAPTPAVHLVVPNSWFVDPIRLHPIPGVPSMGDADVDPDNPLAWQSGSLCAQTDPEAFFPEKGGSTRDAKKICASCEVTEQCLKYALDNDERFGIWGGLSERERRKLRKRRTETAAEAVAGSGRMSLEVKGPFVHPSKRIDHFVELVQGDGDLQELYHEFPEIMAQTAGPLLDEVYSPALTEPLTDQRRQRLLDYFLTKNWDETSRDKLSEDLRDLYEALEELREEHALLKSDVSFAQFYLDKYEEPQFAESVRASA